MKKLITALALVTIGCFALNHSVYSQTTICFDLNITDNCSGQWYGFYSARVSVIFGGNAYCITTINNLVEGENKNLSYDCSECPIDGSSPLYTINVAVCRQMENPTCCGSDSDGPMYYSVLDDCTAQLDVTLN